MRVTSLSLVLAVPFLIAMAVLLPMSLTYEYQYLFPWLLIPVIILTTLYTFRPQIDYWWIMRKEIGLDLPLVTWLRENSLFYNSLNDVDKSKFEIRAGLFLDSKNFILKASKEHKVPEQYKLLSIHEALRITWNREEYLFKTYDRIIMYPHSFPTPKYKYLHPLEIHGEDGIILMSMPHLTNGFLEPDHYFNIGLYSWIRAFNLENTDIPYPNIDPEIIKLDKVFPYPTVKIEELLGHDFLSPLALHIQAYFDYSEDYKSNFQNYFNSFETIFKQRN